MADPKAHPFTGTLVTVEMDYILTIEYKFVPYYCDSNKNDSMKFPLLIVIIVIQQ